MNGLCSIRLLWVLLKCKKGSTSVLWNWKWCLVASERPSLDADVSDKNSSFCGKELLRIDFFWTCSCILKPGIRVELVRGDVLVTLVGSVPYVDSVLSIFAFVETEVVCVWGWKPVLLFCSDFSTVSFSVILHWLGGNSPKLRSLDLFAGFAFVKR